MILVLVGRNGAGPHDLRRMAEQGRVYWHAAPSQWYAEPKRLEKLGYLSSRREPGRTTERTHYELTPKALEALEQWARTPAPLPRMQHESVTRLLAGDLVDPDAVREGLQAMRGEVEEGLAWLSRAREAWGPEVEHRRHLLAVNDRYAVRLLELQLEWLEEAERAL